MSIFQSKSPPSITVCNYASTFSYYLLSLKVELQSPKQFFNKSIPWILVLVLYHLHIVITVFTLFNYKFVISYIILVGRQAAAITNVGIWIPLLCISGILCSWLPTMHLPISRCTVMTLSGVGWIIGPLLWQPVNQKRNQMASAVRRASWRLLG